MLEMPSRSLPASSTVARNLLGVEDKENSCVVGAAVKRRGGEGSGAGKQLSGQKRGGGDIEIERQKSFTGSYFQVTRVLLAPGRLAFCLCSWWREAGRRRIFCGPLVARGSTSSSSWLLVPLVPPPEFP